MSSRPADENEERDHKGRNLLYQKVREEDAENSSAYDRASNADTDCQFRLVLQL